MKRTTISLLFKIVVVTVMVGWIANSVMRLILDTYVYVGAGTSIGLLLVDAALAMWGVQIRHRLPRLEKKADGTTELHRALDPLPPLLAARTAAIAMAATRTGAAVIGFYSGLIIYALPKVHTESAFHHVVMCAPAVIAATVLTAIALWIERRCSPPAPPTAEISSTSA